VALFAAMTDGTSQVSGLLPSLDVRSTLAAIEALGATVDLHEEKTGLAGTITGWGEAGPQLRHPESVSPVSAASRSGDHNVSHGGDHNTSRESDQAASFFSLDCGNSGTTARLLLGLLSGYNLTALLDGDESLSRRPMNRVTLPLTTMGANFEASHDTRTSCTSENLDTLPLVVRGTAALKAIDYRSPVASAQVKSAVLLAGLHASGTTSVTEPSRSRDHTELLLPAFGVDVRTDGLTTSIEGGQSPVAPSSALAVPGDPSSAAFLLVGAALIADSEVTVRDVLLNPTRTGFLEVMRRMGVEISIHEDTEGQTALGAERVGCVTVRYSPSLQATTVVAEEVPSLIDELPILALLATGAQGTTVFQGVGELRVKESDRLAAIEEGLRAMGYKAYSEGDTLYVEGSALSSRATSSSDVPFCLAGLADASSASPIVLPTHGDHRLAMTWTMAQHIYGSQTPIHIDDRACMAVSYPAFLDDLAYLSMP
jgi:3-phosphoshikimate 1-carboxyvinyltransferase